MVSDGSGSVTGPFQAAQTRFYLDQVIPLCTGWFEEIREDFNKILVKIVAVVAAGDVEMSISLLTNIDRKGGTIAIMLHQFRQAIWSSHCPRECQTQTGSTVLCARITRRGNRET